MEDSIAWLKESSKQLIELRKIHDAELAALREARDDAVQEIAALRAENERLRKLMRPFFKDFEGTAGKLVVVFVSREDFDAARAALGEGE